MALTPGTRLGVYAITAQIGEGGMGQVYRATDTRLKRQVAIKILPPSLATTPDRLARFQREAEVLASLNHPNIATIYGVDESEGMTALVMELVDGEDLAQRIARGAIPLDDALPIAKQVAEALDAAHEHGIIHRDLKPANIRVRPDGTVKVLDFGLAKAIEPAAGASPSLSMSPTLSIHATQEGIILGTAAYMAPEQARGRAVDKRADIWAFGAVLYEMMTGRRPFRGDDVSETLAAVIKDEPRWDHVPTHVQPLLKSCLEKDPRKRLRDIGDAWRQLDDAPDVRAREVPRDRRLAWSGFAAALMVALTLGPIAYRHLRQRPPSSPPPVRFQIPPPDQTGLALFGGFSISPDGRTVVFAATGPDRVTRLWLRALDSAEARALAGTEGSLGTSPFWSPDSRSLAFQAAGKLKRIEIAGGPAHTVCEAAPPVVGGSWNRNNDILFGLNQGVVMRVSAAGGTPSPLTRLDPSRQETMHLFPSFLPDGRHFLYMRLSTKPAQSGAYIGSLDARPEDPIATPLVATPYEAAYVASTESGGGRLLFRREGTLMAQRFDDRTLALSGEATPVAEQLGSFLSVGYFSASAGVLVYRTGSAGQNSQLTWVDRHGQAHGRVGEPGFYTSGALAPDGSRVAVARLDFAQSADPDVWIIDFGPGTTTRFTFGPRVAQYPVWSPDGRRLVFRSNRGAGVFDLYQKAADGATSEGVLLKSGETKTPTSWSRDGRFLLYAVANPQTKSDLWVLPLDDDRHPVPFLRTEFNEDQGRFSPDTRWVAYRSDETGRAEIYVRGFSPNASSGQWQVSTEGGSEPRWRGDGKELFYTALDGTVMAVDVATGAAFQAGPARPLFKLPPNAVFSDVVADGQRFLVTVPVQATVQTPFSVVLNWQAALR